MPPVAEWPKLRHEYRHVAAEGTFENGKEALVFRASGGAAGKQRGYLVLTPLRLTSGGYDIVNRGFVPLDRKEQSTRLAGLIQSETKITGLRQPEARNFFTPADDLAAGSYFTRDPDLVAKHFGLAPAAPFGIDVTSPFIEAGRKAARPSAIFQTVISPTPGPGLPSPWHLLAYLRLLLGKGARLGHDLIKGIPESARG